MNSHQYFFLKKDLKMITKTIRKIVQLFDDEEETKKSREIKIKFTRLKKQYGIK